jgi:hypothetical protein
MPDPQTTPRFRTFGNGASSVKAIVTRKGVRAHRLCRGVLMYRAPDHCFCSVRSFA